MTYPQPRDRRRRGPVYGAAPDLGPERASDTAPGLKSGPGAIITGLTEPLVTGGEYQIRLTVSNITGASDVFYPASTGPFPFESLTLVEGVNVFRATAEDGDTTSALRLGTGDAITITSASIRQILDR